MSKTCRFAIALLFALLPVLAFATTSNSVTALDPKQTKVALDGDAGCYACHEPIKELHAGPKSQHKSLNCISCHADLAKHSKDSNVRPRTDFSWGACGTVCHKEQMNSFMQVSYHRPARDDKSGPTNRIPVWYDKLMARHGFTKEHALTRPHVMMLLDQYVVDRAFGGRFQPKNGWEYVLETGKVWDIIEDKYEADPVKTQKAFLPQTATAANPVCISCKTADHILDWAYMGDSGKGAKWDRASNVVQFAKEGTNYALNCFMCHDPHSAEPRIVRDALIDSMAGGNDKYGKNLYTGDTDPNKTRLDVKTLGLRGFDRKIAILSKKDSNIQCAQCHVEYNCNPGTDPETGAAVGFADRRTNIFPLLNVLDLYEFYFEKLKFVDFKNAIDGASLWKAQHPEFETYYNSVHFKSGAACADCHFEKKKSADKKSTVTSHFAQSPRHMMKTSCLANCHTGVKGKGMKMTTEQALYTVDSIKAYTKSRMRKAEYWLSTLIDRIREADLLGVDVKAARTAHTKAHILWEYWTAENSDGFHNPALARQSITQSITISMAAIDELDKAIASKHGK